MAEWREEEKEQEEEDDLPVKERSCDAQTTQEEKKVWAEEEGWSAVRGEKVLIGLACALIMKGWLHKLDSRWLWGFD